MLLCTLHTLTILIMTYLSEHVLHIKYWSPISQNSAWPLSPARSTPPPPATAHGQHEWAVKTVTVRPWSGVAARVSDVAGGSGRSGTVGRGRSVGDGRSGTVGRGRSVGDGRSARQHGGTWGQARSGGWEGNAYYYGGERDKD